MNRDIRAKEVRVIHEDGNEQLGIMPLQQALALAEGDNLDLVEISPNANPPVCKIMNYGKFKYREQKKSQEIKKKRKESQLKEVKLRPVTDEHDYQTKMRNARKFLENGDKVKFLIFFRGREMAHQELGINYLNRIKTDLEGLVNIESEPKMEGRHAVMLVSPNKNIKKD